MSEYKTVVEVKERVGDARVGRFIPRRAERRNDCNTEDGVDVRVPGHEAIVGSLDLSEFFAVAVLDRG